MNIFAFRAGVCAPEPHTLNGCVMMMPCHVECIFLVTSAFRVRVYAEPHHLLLWESSFWESFVKSGSTSMIGHVSTQNAANHMWTTS
jgi:hypothetical protein